MPGISRHQGSELSSAVEPGGEPFFVDRAALRRGFDRAAETFAGADVLYREVAARMLERFDVIKLEPRRIVDLGCGPGRACASLRARFPAASLTGVDLALGMLRAAMPALSGWRRFLGGGGGPMRAVCADMAALPFASGVFDLAWSNLALHWLDDPLPAIRETSRALAPGGLFMFSTLGPDTLRELREGFAAAGDDWHVKRFIDLHDVGDALGAAGFANPVMDMEILTLTYETVDALFADLRATGAGNVLRARRRTLTGARRFGAMREAYETRRREGRLPATFEIVYGHAWKAAPRRNAGGEAVVSFLPRRK
jgi:malonyl-CoA O-methyltransferase